MLWVLQGRVTWLRVFGVVVPSSILTPRGVRFPDVLRLQVPALADKVEVKGSILDCCGGNQDAISTVMTTRGFRVATNDFNPKYVFLTDLN